MVTGLCKSLARYWYLPSCFAESIIGWLRVWGNDSIGKVFTSQAQGPEFNPENSDKKSVLVAWAYYPDAGRQGTAAWGRIVQKGGEGGEGDGSG